MDFNGFKIQFVEGTKQENASVVEKINLLAVATLLLKNIIQEPTQQCKSS